MHTPLKCEERLTYTCSVRRGRVCVDPQERSVLSLSARVLAAGALSVALTVGLTAADVVVAQPAEAVTVGGSYLPPYVFLYFNRSESKRIGVAANTGFTPFVASFCALIPGGARTFPIKSGCAVSAAVTYGRIGLLFKQAAAQNKCVRVSYPVGFPLSNPTPLSRVQSC